jgi:predicted RNA-binding Zn-ribbon protein involved in translation (DUF1610 family)
MKCTRCGAELLETDTFCPNCGEKVKKLNICPFCGAELREGTRFCPKCGREVSAADEPEKEAPHVPEDDDIPVVKQMETKDIPFDDIEKNIIFEAAQQVKSRDYKSGNKKDAHHRITDDRTDADDKRNMEKPDRYREEPEEESDDDDGGEESVNTMKLPMIIVGILIIAVIAVLFIKMKGVIGGEEPETGTAAATVQQTAGTKAEGDRKIIGQVEVVSDVNIRNKPSKDGSEVIDTAKAGEKFDYYGYGDDAKNWVWIKLSDGSEGYIYKDFVKTVQ